jgi:hypothetical protein
MWKVNFCPRCGARASGDDRFCGTCGLNLTCVVPQVPPPSYDYLHPYHQWVLHNPSYDQAAAPENAEQCRQRYVSDNDRNATPISAEISKLLRDLFDKSLKYQKT